MNEKKEKGEKEVVKEGGEKILDFIDKQIIAELQEDGRVGIVELGKKVGLSHAGVSKRLKRLINEDLIKIRGELNLEKLNLQMAVLGIEVDGLDKAMELANRFSPCPRVAFVAPMTGNYNLVMILACENFKCLQNIIEKTIRPQSGIRRFSTSFTATSFKPTHLPIKTPTKKSDKTPCGKKCIECEPYIKNLCLGCPSTTQYKGTL